VLKRRRLRGALTATAVALAVPMVYGVPAAVQAATPGARATSAASKSPDRTVTLITGDRITVSGSDPSHASIQRGPGREKMVFFTEHVGTDVHVIPVDAIGLLRAGKLDPQLFDITQLLRFGYDDSRPDLPLIVQATSTAAAAPVRSAMSAAGGTGLRSLPNVSDVAVHEQKAQAGRFWSALTAGADARTADKAAGAATTLPTGEAKVWLDGLLQPTVDVNVSQIGAPTAWQAGYTGDGVTVAVLDSGIDDTHPDLVGKVVAKANFTDGTEDDRDLVGHGTHVASTIAGSGAASDGQYRGVAPGVSLISGKVCYLKGCPESWVLAGMQWAAAQEHAKIVNLSLGEPDTPGIDPLEEAVNTLTAQYGTLFVVAAGNDGTGGQISTPASADDALAVGAVDSADEPADFSSRGPRVGDDALKPDITAPGVNITAARGKDAVGLAGDPSDPYVTMSGTSMATPHVAGSAAILAQENPDWGPDQLKAALMGAAKPSAGTSVLAQGAGRVDVGRAIGQTVTSQPPSVSFGEQLWPHDDDAVLTKTVTYRNSAASDVTLNLAVTAVGPDGQPSPADMFTLDKQTVTVPAGGQATVTLTADTRQGGPDGQIGGRITATAGDLTVQTPFSVHKEVESYNLTLNFVDRSGQPDTDWLGALSGVDNNEQAPLSGPQSTVTMRLPRGSYNVTAFLPNGGDDPNGTFLVDPVAQLTSDQTVAMDARLAKPVDVSVPEPSAVLVNADIGYSLNANRPDGTALGGDVGSTDLQDTYTAQIGDQHSVAGLASLVYGAWDRGNADGSTTGSPYMYNLAYWNDGRMWTGLVRHPSNKDLATVHIKQAQTMPGSVGQSTVSFQPPPGVTWGVIFSSPGISGPLPLTGTAYYNGDPGAEFTTSMSEQLPDDPTNVLGQWQTATVSYQNGHTYQQQWNKGVFGPGFPAPPDPALWISREGNSLNVVPSLFDDGAGHDGYTESEQDDTVTLSRNGTVIGTSEGVESGEFTMPADPGQYQLEIKAERGAPFTLSTTVDTVWKFNSAQTDPSTWVRQPLSAITFAPFLDDRNAAPAGVPYTVPITVTPQPGSAAGALKNLTVEVSYDDGVTWHGATVAPTESGGLALLHHPADADYVSLKATATDTAGGSVTQTIIRAYRLAKR
jgi:subtilisin family serine protease